MNTKFFIYGVAGLFLTPVLYSVIMAFVPETTESMQAINSDKTVKSGEEMYQKCAACHGVNGDGSDGYPALNTLAKTVLVEKMVAFHQNASGSTNQAIMKAQLEGMSRFDIEKLSEFIIKFKPNENMKKKDNVYKQKKEDHALDTTSVSS